MSPPTGQGVAVRAEYRQVVSRSELLAALPDSVVADLVRSLRVTVLAPGAVLPEPPGQRLWFVVAGRLAVTTPGGDRLLSVLAPGDVVGEEQVFGAQWPVSVVATAEAVVAGVDREDVLAWVTRHPTACRHLLHRMASRLAGESIAAALPTAVESTVRVARGVLSLADKYTVDGVVAHGLTQQQLADLVGLSRERLNKSLHSFSRRRWLELRPRAFQVLDRPALEHRAGRSPDESTPVDQSRDALRVWTA